MPAGRTKDGKFAKGNKASLGCTTSGRKTKYKKKYCEMLIDFMAKGLSPTAFAGEISVNPDTVYEWFKVHPEFSESLKIGKAKTALYFEKMGISAMAGKIAGFQQSTYIFTMKNKCGWTDKNEVENKGAINITITKEDSGL